jgi:hypothetical protein
MDLAPDPTRSGFSPKHGITFRYYADSGRWFFGDRSDTLISPKNGLTTKEAKEWLKNHRATTPPEPATDRESPCTKP